MTTKDTKKRLETIIPSFFANVSDIEKREKLPIAFECTFRFFACFIFSAVSFGSGFSPFALSLAAVSGVGAEGIFAAAGAVFGYFLFGGLSVYMRYMVSVVLCFVCFFVLRPLKISQSKYFRPAVAAIITASTGFVYITNALTAVSFCSEILTVFYSAFAFKLILSPRPADADYRYGISASLFISVLCAGLSGLSLFSVLSLGRVASTSILLLISFKCGYGKACPFGIICGIIMDLAGGKGLFFSLVYPVSAAVSSAFFGKGLLPFSVSFVTVNFLSALLLRESYFFIPCLYETFAGTVFFLLTPKAVLNKFAALFPVPASSLSGSANEYVKDKLDLMADGVKSLYLGAKDAVISVRNDENIASVFDRAAEISCRKCKNMHYCWQENYQGTLNVLNNLTEKMVSEGCVNVSDFPLYFTEKCRTPELFVSALNSELRSLIYRRQFKAKYSENITAAYRNYADMYLILKGASSELDSSRVDYKAQHKLRKYLRSIGCSVSSCAFRDKFNRLHLEFTGDEVYRFMQDSHWLDSLSEALSIRLCTTDVISGGRLTVLEAEPYCVNVGLAAAAKNGGERSGDMGKFFKTDGGVMYVILSDGLGTGDEAFRMSRDAVGVLEKFLKAGLPPETALRILSDAFLLKNESEIYSAAIDLMCIDLFTGKGKIFKSGSAPSYIKKDGSVTELKSETFSAGLSTGTGFSPSVADISFEDGTCAFIFSDGIVAGKESEVWISDLLTGIDGSTGEMSRKILAEAERRYGKSDDLTAICVSFSTRK